MDILSYLERYKASRPFVHRLETVTQKGQLGEYTRIRKRFKRETDLEEAKLITSRISGTDRHALILDIDVPVEVWESSSGNTHLLIDVSLSKRELNSILRVLAKTGVVQSFWAKQGINRQNGAALRLPWIRKKNNDRTLREDREAEQRKRAVEDHLFDTP